MSILDNIAKIKADTIERLGQADSLDSINEVQITTLGRKGSITSILKSLKDLDPAERKQVGAQANKVRAELTALIESAKENLAGQKQTSAIDPTLPSTSRQIGVAHITTQTIKEICDTFQRMGFEIAKGPNVETDYYNFEALNFPPDHPARDMQDTMFVENGRLLRTHTTPVQSRFLETHKPPIKIITPGICYRNEAISTRSHVAFHQVDGFVIAEGITMADLKGALNAFCKSYFGEDVKLKFRPSYFPFTEPSCEVDISCFLCSGKGCQVCKYAGWLEILGCGMIDPNVLENAGIDSEKYTGYAFGIGVERPAMLKHKIKDIRLFFNNDTRFLRQFK